MQVVVFGEGLRLATDKMDSKNFYAFNPAFDKQRKTRWSANHRVLNVCGKSKGLIIMFKNCRFICPIQMAIIYVVNIIIFLIIMINSFFCGR